MSVSEVSIDFHWVSHWEVDHAIMEILIGGVNAQCNYYLCYDHAKIPSPVNVLSAVFCRFFK